MWYTNKYSDTPNIKANRAAAKRYNAVQITLCASVAKNICLELPIWTPEE